MGLQIIPLMPSPFFSFLVTFGENNYTFLVRWNFSSLRWSMSCYLEKQAIFEGRVLTPRRNILKSLAIPSLLPGELFLLKKEDFSSDELPTADNLPTFVLGYSNA